MAVNPADPENLLGACQFEIGATTRLPGTFASFDGGRTWHDDGLLPLPAGYDQGADTTVAFDGHVGFVVALLSSGGGGHPSRVTAGGVFIWRTTNGGRTFSRPIPVFVGPGFQDHPWLAISTTGATSMYVVWTNDRGLELSVSHDHGSSFRRPRLLVGGTAPADPVVTTATGNQVSVFYEQLGGASQPLSLSVLQSSDAGSRFSPPERIGSVTMPLTVGGGPKGDVDQPPPLFGVATDGDTGLSAIAISGMNPQLGHPTLHVWHQSAIAAGWAGPVEPVTGPDAAETQVQPRLSFVAHRLLISFFVVNRSGQIAERLLDGRPTGYHEDRLAGSAFRTSSFIGDYQAMAIGGSHVYLLWNETVSGRLEIVADSLAPG